MNIFRTSHCPIQSAMNLCDVHVNKMIVESAQLLYTSHWKLDKAATRMKPTHIGHPCVTWVCKSSANYEWLYLHFLALLDRYNKRKGKVHACQQDADVLANIPNNLVNREETIAPKCMPDMYKHLPITEAYQVYLKDKYISWQTRTDKKRIKVVFSNTTKPTWLT